MNYPGNKSRLLKQLLPLVPSEYNVYFEPFVGSGAMFLALEPEKAVISDINKDVINVWKAVKKSPKKLLEHLKVLTESIEKLKRPELLKYARELTQCMLEQKYTLERAGLYLFLTQISFMGKLFYGSQKFHSLGVTEKLFSSFIRPRKINSILNASKDLESVKIYNKDYKIILRQANKGDFVYLDPPYIYDESIKRTTYIIYNNKGEENILEDLKKQMDLLTDRGVYVMLSNSDYPIIRKTFKGYNIDNVKAYRGFRNVYENELVIRNYSI